MSSVEYLREFVSETLSAAAEEIFRVFKKAVAEYEEEISRQRRLLDVVWKPEKLHGTEQYICQEEEEEVLTNQQLCDQERNSSQEDPEPPQIKEEEEELCTSQEAEQLVLKQDTNTFMLTPTYEESDHSEDQTVCLNHNLTQSATEEEHIVNIFKSSVVPEMNSDHQLLSYSSHEADSEDNKEDKHGDSGLTPKTKCHSNTVCKIHLNTDKKFFKCDTCGKDFKDKSKLDRHLRIHTGEKPYFCNTCGNSFSDISILRRHIMIHTGVRPYSCETCGKNFRLNSDMKVHLRTHTGEKPYNCSTCGKRYCRMTDLKKHIRIHASEKQCTCETLESTVMT